MYRVPLLFLFLALPILLTPAESTAQQLDRISVAQRSDGGGLVLRYHLTAEPDSYTLHRPRADLIQMNLYGVRASGMVELPEPGVNQIERVEFFETAEGISVDIYLEERTYVGTDVYPDINGRDLLLSLAYVSEVVVEGLIDPRSEISREEEEEPVVEEEEVTQPLETPRRQPETQVEPRTDRRQITFGIQAGLSASTVSSNAFTSGLRTGLTLGAVVNIPLPPQFQPTPSILSSIETGILYTEKGMTDMNPDFLNAETVEFDYIEIPILGKFSLPVSPAFEPYLIAGPSLGFMVSAERIRKDGRRLDLDKRTSSADLAFILGGGIETRIGNTILYGQARGSLSLGNTFKSEQRFERTDRFKHQYIALEVGIRF